MDKNVPFFVSLFAGGAAGLSVDISMFPLDTLKTRLQSPQGFWKAGGFYNVYRGIIPAAVGSVPTAALFFCTYDTSKHCLERRVDSKLKPFVHMFSASAGEVVACFVRVPIEIIKQRLQTSGTNLSAVKLALNVWQQEGLRGCYRGLGSTILREIPFSCLQFPLWEFFKSQWQQKQNRATYPIEGSVLGAVSGGISAAITTPLDVAKTRIMLFSKTANASIETVPTVLQALNIVYKEAGINGLFCGVLPRVTWITVGGLIFFGVYEHSVHLLQR